MKVFYNGMLLLLLPLGGLLLLRHSNRWKNQAKEVMERGHQTKPAPVRWQLLTE